MFEGPLAVGEFLESSFETPELHVVFCRGNRLEHAHRFQSILELLVDVLADVDGRWNETGRMLQILSQGLEITNELLNEFIRDD